MQLDVIDYVPIAGHAAGVRHGIMMYLMTRGWAQYCPYVTLYASDPVWRSQCATM